MADDAREHWEGDVNEAVRKEWKAETTPFERVQAILRATSTPQYAGEIGDRARVSEPTARTHLKRLVQTGHAEAVETTQGIQYKRSRQTVAMRRIVELHRELSREDLIRGLRRLRTDINKFQDRFDATDPDDLAIQIEDGDAEKAWKAVTEWRSLAEDLDIAKAALALYEFDPDAGSDRSGADTSNTGRGAFAESSSNANADRPNLSETA